MQMFPVFPWLKLLGAECFLLPAKTGMVPAALPSVGEGEQQCHPSVSSAAIGIVNVHSLFLWAKSHVGCSQRGADLITGTEKPALEDAAMTMQLVL